MTDTQFYDDMFGLATELMNDFGTPATLRKVHIGEVGADGKAAKTTEDFPGLAVRISDMEIIKAMELVGDIGYVCKFPAQPEQGDLILHAGGIFESVSNKLVNPEGNRLILSFHGVKQA